MIHRPACRRPAAAVGLILTLAAALVVAAPAHAWEIRQDAPAADFARFHDAFAPAAFPAPRHGAGPLGWIGFEIFAEASAIDGVGNEAFADTTIRGSLPADALTIARVGARKGLPGGFDIGASYGEVVSADFNLLSADVKWSILEGGPLKPALALRVSGTRSSGSDVYDFQQTAVDLSFSKGFANLTPYVGVGLLRSESRLDRIAGDPLKVDSTDQILFAGVTINLLVPRITLAVEQGDQLQAAVRLSIGL
ncbi:MAG: hypothetical protein KDD11_04355 [Acidobacteria bacterium]|nr:hypothetical protein [Acidobacteriota bacterium]